METIREYIESMFKNLPQTEKVLKAKQELLSMMEDKYEELKNEGKSENEAIGTIITEFGNLEDLAAELGIDEEINEKKSASKKQVISLDTIKEYLKDAEKRSVLSALCPALVLTGISFLVSNFKIEDLNLVIFIVFIALNMGLRKYLSYGFSKWEKIDNCECSIGNSGKSFVNSEKNSKLKKLVTFQTIGKVLCVLCIVPLFLFNNTSFEELQLSALFLVLSCGIFCKKYADHMNGFYTKLCELESNGIWYKEPEFMENSFEPESKSSKKTSLVLDIIRTSALLCFVIFVVFGSVYGFKKIRSYIKDFPSIINIEDNSETFILNEDFEEEFSKIRISGTVMDVTVKEGENAKLFMKYRNSKPEVKIVDDTLEIIQDSKFFNNNTGTVVITVPDSKVYNMNVKTNVSDIKVHGLNFDDLKLCTNVGDLNVSDSSFITLYGKTNTGDLNVKMSEPVSDYSVSASTNTGDISIAGMNTAKKYEATGTNNSKKIQLKTNTGDIRLK